MILTPDSRRWFFFLCFAFLSSWTSPPQLFSASPEKTPYFATDDQPASHRGVYEVKFYRSGERSHFSSPFRVNFKRPDGSKVIVDAFPDGHDVFRARAYCDQTGKWEWSLIDELEEAPQKTGEFQVVSSDLPGKLRIHPEDPRQFAYDDGSWFLHIGDTAYRYAADSEPHWKEYLDQAVQMGATKTRIWFCRSRHGVEALLSDDRTKLNLAYWQEIERRIQYALENHPHLILQLIPYGEDTDELRRYQQGDTGAIEIARHAQARFSAFPNVQWCISNDMILGNADNSKTGHRRVDADIIRLIGKDMADREPWSTLLTNHQSRRSGYFFVDEPWSDIITLEDLDQVHGELLLAYREQGQAPVVNDEDRYEYYHRPEDPRYFFRRLMWGSLLSGGHATYCGLKTYEPYDGELQGVQGYFDAHQKGILNGADDFPHLHTFFRDSGLTLVGYEPDDASVGGDPMRVKCLRNDQNYLIYHANPSTDAPGTARPSENPPSLEITLPEKVYHARWFNPTSGQWVNTEAVTGPRAHLSAPAGGDWVLWLCAE